MVGSALIRLLESQKNYELITASRKELDLTNQAAVNDFFKGNRIDIVYLAAARVGGIHANSTYPAEFIYENLMIEANIINAAHINDVHKLLFLGSSCIYPKFADQPMKESALLTGALEPSNEPYAIAKIAGLKLCESYRSQYSRDYRSVMPTNLYGPNDNFHAENSHVIPSMIRRFHEAKTLGAKSVTVWGSGKPKREFLHVDDLADACLFIMGLDVATYNNATLSCKSHVNVGSGIEHSIGELALKVLNTVSLDAKIIFDDSKLDGAPRKLMDSSVLSSLGWNAKISLDDGLVDAYKWFTLAQKIRH